MPLTTQGRETAVEALKERRANRPDQIDNSSLPAGSPMYFYCVACGHYADEKPECYTSTPKSLCEECQALKDLGWLV
jgi:hypothetical protein